jgi:hypothetical protein
LGRANAEHVKRATHARCYVPRLWFFLVWRS